MGANDETHGEGCNDATFMAVILLYYYLIPSYNYLFTINVTYTGIHVAWLLRRPKIYCIYWNKR